MFNAEYIKKLLVLI